MTNRTKLILGLVGAAAAGVAIGLLLAPEKGTDLRRKVGEKATDWAGGLTDLFSNAKDEISNWTGKARKGAGNITESYS